jgi:aspartate racemase
LTCVTPTKEEQTIISNIIFEQIKQNKPVDISLFEEVVDSLRAKGCEKIVLGCTELSLLKKQGLDEDLFVDSLDVLAHRTILACGKTPIGFSASFDWEVTR